jgi:hypothetical protein
MSGEYKARGEDWAEQGEWARISSYRTARCLLELRSRVELLEATQHAHLDGSQLSEAEREAMKEPGKVVTDQPEPAPLATDEELRKAWDVPPSVTSPLRAVYNLGRQHGARAAATEADNATAATVAEIRSLLFKDAAQPAPAALAESVSVLDAKAWAYIGRQAILGDPDAQSLVDLLSDAPAAQPEPPTLQESQAKKAHYEAELARLKCEAMHQPAPAVKDSLTDAPAGGLVERVAGRLSAACGLQDGQWDEAAIDVLRAVADWLRENDSEREMGGDAAATADLIEQESSR